MKISHHKQLVGFFIAMIVVLNNGFLCAQTSRANIIKPIFERGSTYEHQMLMALKFNPDNAVIAYNGPFKKFNDLTPLQRAFGRLSLQAAEILSLSESPEYTDPVKFLQDIEQRPAYQARLNGILAVLVMAEIGSGSMDVSAIRLREWSTTLYKSIKIRTSQAVLNEFEKWKNNPCNYKGDGYKPEPDCFTGNYNELFASKTPPQEILAKMGMKSVLSSNADKYANFVALGIASATFTTAATILAGIMGTVVSQAASSVAATVLTLNAAFSVGISGAGGVAGVTTGPAAAAAIGNLGWASVIAAPLAATVLAIVVGTTQGFKVVEDQKVGPMLKQKLGAAITDNVIIKNVVSDERGRNMFFLAFMEAAQKSYQFTPVSIPGEVRFYCQGGYVMKGQLAYTLNGNRTETSTAVLNLGSEQSLDIPAGAKDIVVSAYYDLAGWKEIFKQPLKEPTYICYTTYGIINRPEYKTDCPEVGNMASKMNMLTVTQGGGFIAWIIVDYEESPGVTKRLINKGDASLGWRQEIYIPDHAKNIRLQVHEHTGFEWKNVFDRTWPVAPNECIKVYGTTLDPKWNNECK